jgi:hypothetical protein
VEVEAELEGASFDTGHRFDASLNAIRRLHPPCREFVELVEAPLGLARERCFLCRERSR